MGRTWHDMHTTQILQFYVYVKHQYTNHFLAITPVRGILSGYTFCSFLLLWSHCCPQFQLILFILFKAEVDALVAFECNLF